MSAQILPTRPTAIPLPTPSGPRSTPSYRPIFNSPRTPTPTLSLPSSPDLEILRGGEGRGVRRL